MPYLDPGKQGKLGETAHTTPRDQAPPAQTLEVQTARYPQEGKASPRSRSCTKRSHRPRPLRLRLVPVVEGKCGGRRPPSGPSRTSGWTRHAAAWTSAEALGPRSTARTTTCLLWRSFQRNAFSRSTLSVPYSFEKGLPITADQDDRYWMETSHDHSLRIRWNSMKTAKSFGMIIGQILFFFFFFKEGWNHLPVSKMFPIFT